MDNITEKQMRSKRPIEEESFADALMQYFWLAIKFKMLIIITLIVASPIIFIILKKNQPVFQSKYKISARVRVITEGITDDTVKRNIKATDAYIKKTTKDLMELMRSSVVLEKTIADTKSGLGKSYIEILQNPETNVYILTSELNYVSMQLIDTIPSRGVNIINGIIKNTRDELLKYKMLIAEEARISMEKELNQVRYELEQAKSGLTKFIVENELLSKVIDIEEDKFGKQKQKLVEDADQLALTLVKTRAQKTQAADFIDLLEETRQSSGDIEAYKILSRHADYQIFYNEKLIDDLAKHKKELSALLLVNKEAHPDVIRAQEKLQQSAILISEELDKVIESLTQNKNQLKSHEDKIVELIEKGLSNTMIEYSQLLGNVEVKERLAKKAADSLQELNLAAKLIETTSFVVVDEPIEPQVPFNLYEKTKTTANNFLFSIVLSLGMGIMLAYIIDYFAMAIKDLREVEENLDFPILGEIPYYGDSQKEKKYSLPINEDTHSIASEAFKGLRTNIKFRCMNKEIKTVLVTSLVPEEGKTFVCSNLAVAFSQTDKNVLLMDCDLRKSTLHKYFRLDNEKGIIQLLQGDLDVKPRDAGISNLSVLTAGKHGHNAAELLSSDAFDKTLADLKQKYDILFIDSPPLLAVADPMILIKKVDIVILTLRSDVTPKKALRRASKFSQDINSKILGVAFNGISLAKSKYGSYYYYKYDYYGKDKDTKDKKKT